MKKGGTIIIKFSPRKTEYLLLYNQTSKNFGFPKGRAEIEDKNSFKNTAVRETFEETGLKAGKDYIFTGSIFKIDSSEKYFICILKPSAYDKKIKLTEHSKYLYCSVLENLLLNRGAKRFLFHYGKRGFNNLLLYFRYLYFRELERHWFIK